MWSPQPALGGALWSGNGGLATTRQLLSTSAGLANTGDNEFDTAKVSTLFVSTITSLDGQSLLNIRNISSIVVSTFRNFVVNAENIQTTAKLNNFNFLNGTYALINRDLNTGVYDPVTNLTNLTTGTGSFQALTGALTIAATTSTLNLYSGEVINMTGRVNANSNDFNHINGLSSIYISTSQIRVGTSAFDSISSLRISTGTLRAGNSAIDSISSLSVSTGTARVGVANIGTLTVGAVTLSGSLDMCNNNINNVATLTATTVNAGTVGATAGNFVTLSGTLTGNVNGNVSGNLTGNVTGNISNANLTVLGQYSITETADVGSAISNYGSYGRVDIAGRGGLGGIVTITADSATPLNPAVTVSQLTVEAKGNYGLITPGSPVGYVPRGGLVSIIARQGLTPTPPAEVTSALFANGEIDLTAYSYGVVPGLIKLSSGANAMYAGAISPLTGIFGNNYIFGQYGNSILAGLPPSGVPNVPGENYIYALNGTVIDGGLYTDTIYNKFGGNLNLDSRTSNINITSSNAGGSLSLTSPTITLTGSSAINLTGNATISGNLDMTDGTISNVGIMSATSGSNMTIQNTDHFINFPPPDITYATGGTITVDSGRTIHTFTADGTFTLLVSVGEIEVMAIGGGGGGGAVSGGGGGAGNMVVVTSNLPTGSYTITVGAGGAGGTVSTNGGAGSQSRFSATGINIRALGGGGGSTEGVAGGGNGGCGGGGSGGTESFGGVAGTGVTTGMTVVSNVAFDGGSNPGAGNVGPAGSGGGGVFSVGQDVSAITPSDGGDGGGAIYYLGTYYGGGGGGSAAPTGVYGAPKKGRGGGTAPPTSGGNGSLGATSTQAEPGVANTGGGGGGGEDATGGYAGAAGGSGIVIVSYLTPTPPLFTLGSRHVIFFSTSTTVVENDLIVQGTTNIQATNVNSINSVTIVTSGTAEFSGPSTIITGQLLGQNNKPIAITTGVATGFWNPNTVGTVTTSGAASFSNADNPSGFAVADFNAYMSLLSFNNLNATDFYLNDMRIQQNSSGTYWSVDCDAVAYNPNVYLSNQNVQWIVNAMFIPKSLS